MPVSSDDLSLFKLIIVLDANTADVEKSCCL